MGFVPYMVSYHGNPTRTTAVARFAKPTWDTRRVSRCGNLHIARWHSIDEGSKQHLGSVTVLDLLCMTMSFHGVPMVCCSVDQAVVQPSRPSGLS